MLISGADHVFRHSSLLVFIREKSMTIRELLDGIKQLDLVLPEFQREYVWEKEQAKQLLVSLIRGYPTGSLLVWKTDNPPDIKNSAIDKNRIGRRGCRKTHGYWCLVMANIVL
jgi:hypothetical protein